MSITQCPNGHFYDDKKYAVCPVCRLSMQGQLPQSDKTLGLTAQDLTGFDRTVGFNMLEEDALAWPVVGWLVCVQGAERGRDWRLHEGQNFAGNTLGADIQLSVLPRGSEKTFSVIYDGRHNVFLAAPGQGALVYCNGELLKGPVQLHDSDEISVEGMVLCFQSFCTDTRRW